MPDPTPLLKRSLLVAALFIFALRGYSQPGRPNVIVILMDDMGYGDTEPYGMTGIATPNFNRVAREGMRFTHFNSGQPICTASRAALLTGCYPNRVGMHGAILPELTMALNPAEETIASVLKRRGYATAMLGKWHLGNNAPYFPTHYGFDSFFGIPYSNDIWNRDMHGVKVTDTANRRSHWPALPLISGDRVVDSVTSMEGQGKLTAMFTQKAVDFIVANKTRPFFLYLAHPMPHVPLAPGAMFKGRSEMGTFGDVIMELDWSLGRILATLDRENLSKNTIVIVTSDNGPWLNYGDNAGSSGGFREGKSTSWDGGSRVPLLVRWPGKIQAGSINSKLMTNMDLLPTIAAATGARLPQNRIDGIDFLPLLTGKTDKPPREVYYYYFGDNNLNAVRYKNWKLVLPHTSSSYTGLHGVNGDGGPIAHVPVPMALYDLAHDPGEAYDVQRLYPEMVKKIMTYVEEARADLGDGLTNHPGANRRPAASTGKQP